MSTAVATLEGLRAVLAAESRSPLDCPVRRLRLCPKSGRLRPHGLAGDTSLALEESGFRALLAATGGVFPRALPVLLRAPTALRADFFNGMLEHHARELGAVAVRLWCRTLPGAEERSVYTVGGEPGTSAADLVDALLDGLGPALLEATATVAYTRETADLTVLLEWPDILTVRFWCNDGDGGEITAHVGQREVWRRRRRGHLSGDEVTDAIAKLL